VSSLPAESFLFVSYTKFIAVVHHARVGQHLCNSISDSNSNKQRRCMWRIYAGSENPPPQRKEKGVMQDWNWLLAGAGHSTKWGMPGMDKFSVNDRTHVEFRSIFFLWESSKYECCRWCHQDSEKRCEEGWKYLFLSAVIFALFLYGVQMVLDSSKSTHSAWSQQGGCHRDVDVCRGL